MHAGAGVCTGRQAPEGPSSGLRSPVARAEEIDAGSAQAILFLQLAFGIASLVEEHPEVVALRVKTCDTCQEGVSWAFNSNAILLNVSDHLSLSGHNQHLNTAGGFDGC